MAERKTRCSAMVGRGRGGISACARNATAVVDGKPFCAQHQPDTVAKRQRAWKDKFKLQNAVADARTALDVAKARLVDACMALDPVELAMLPERLANDVKAARDARKALDEARERQREAGVPDNWLTRGR